MMIVNALLMVLTTTGLNDAYTDYKVLTTKLDNQVEWIDKYGSKVRNRAAAQKSLNHIVSSLHQPVFSLRHRSKWKSDQRYSIIHVDSETNGYRIFFQCKRSAQGSCVVTKIKITER